MRTRRNSGSSFEAKETKVLLIVNFRRTRGCKEQNSYRKNLFFALKKIDDGISFT